MSKEAMKLALDALENHEGNYKLGDAGCYRHEKAITALQEALAEQPAQRIAELEALLERQTARIVDLQTHIDNFDGGDR